MTDLPFKRIRTLNCGGSLLTLHEPVVMGILNVTPDSFSDGGMYVTDDAILKRAEDILEDGAKLIDIGGYSSRPGAEDIAEEEELRRAIPAVKAVAQHFPEALISIDTFRSRVAAEAVAAGACLVNDISAGSLDPAMAVTIADAGVPWIMMHMRGTPQTMQDDPQYADLVYDILDYLRDRINIARDAGVTDIILDPGFGFGKTTEHNFMLLEKFEKFSLFHLPLLAGISRKGFLRKTYGPDMADVRTHMKRLHLQLLQKGADILRVHDVKDAVEVVHSYREVHGTV